MASDGATRMASRAGAAAENAVRRAAGTLIFANADDPAVRELQMLYDAVVPVILSD